MTSSATAHEGEPQDPQISPVRVSRSRLSRRFTAMTDVLPAAFGLGGLVYLVLAPAASTSTGGKIALGIWTGLWGLAVLPGVSLLASVPPRKRLREASALFDRAAVFGKFLWSAVVFIGPLAIATAVGIGASATADAQGPAAAMDALFGGEAQALIFRVLGVVTSLAAGHMVAMWLVDLGAVVRAGEADNFVLRLERRWTGHVRQTELAAGLRRGAREALEAGAKIGLPILAITILVAYWGNLT